MTSARKINAILPAISLAIALSACSSGDDDNLRNISEDAFIDVSHGETTVCGVVAISLIDTATTMPPISNNDVIKSAFSRSFDYAGMEDNDIRGFLDGSFKEGWNQVSQAHVRLGRRGRNPAFGELELFRNLQRWADLPLPQSVTINSARINLSLESGPPYPVEVAIYAVHKDWNPGRGGIDGDNNSPPNPGEAWWLDAKYDEQPWSQPGAGHASDEHPEADTGAQPLAIARYEPEGSDQLVFSSTRLTEYVEARIQAGAPVLLLYKQLDVYEDSPGSVLEIWSANYGVDGSARRPRLQLTWQPANAAVTHSYPVSLEPGRYVRFANIDVGGRRILTASYNPSPDMIDAENGWNCDASPFIEYRLADSDRGWNALSGPTRIEAGKIDIRVAAVQDPVALGSNFTAVLRDTWVTEGEPGEQKVQWHFTSPVGEMIHGHGEYIGDYSWQVSLPVNAIGRWQYRWSHSLAGKEMIGGTRVFDVVAWEPEQVIAGLEQLQKAIAASGAAPRSHEMLPFELSFMRLQRAAVALQSEYGAHGDTAGDVASGLRQIRELITGKAVPQQFVPRSLKSREGK